MVRYAMSLLRDVTKDWRKLIGNTCLPVKVATMAWPEFSTLFKEELIQVVNVQQLIEEFISLRQTIESVNEITALFYKKSLFFPEYVAKKAMNISKYNTMLKDEMHGCMVTARCKTICEMIEVARLCEIELERQMKLKRPTPTQTTSQPQKK